MDASDDYLSTDGIAGNVYFADVPNIHTQMAKVKELGAELSSLDNLVEGGTGFHLPFESFVHQKESDTSYPATSISEAKFKQYLAQFLCSEGIPFMRDFRFKSEFNCGMSSVPDIKLFSMGYRHKRYDHTVKLQFSWLYVDHSVCTVMDQQGNQLTISIL